MYKFKEYKEDTQGVLLAESVKEGKNVHLE